MKRNAIRSLVVMMIAVMVFALTPVPVSAASKAPGKVKKVSVKVTSAVSTTTNKTTVVIKWKKAKKATGYIIWAKHGTGEWVKQKKVGKRYTKLKLLNVPAGQLDVKVQAVNKKKKGKFSAIKSKFIASNTTFERYVKSINFSYLRDIENAAKDKGFTTSVSGNTVTFTCDLAADGYTLSDSDIAKLEPTASADLAKRNVFAQELQNEIRLDTGISGVKVAFKYMYGAKTVASKTF